MRARLRDGTTGKLSLGNQIIAGASAGLAQSLVSSPMDMFKIHAQDGRGFRRTLAKRTLSPTMAGKIKNRVENRKNLSNIEIIPCMPSMIPAGLLGIKFARNESPFLPRLKGVYLGWTAQVIREVPFSMLYFPFYALVRQILTREGEHPSNG